jgi:hypothetical protein
MCAVGGGALAVPIDSDRENRGRETIAPVLDVCARLAAQQRRCASDA